MLIYVCHKGSDEVLHALFSHCHGTDECTGGSSSGGLQILPQRHFTLCFMMLGHAGHIVSDRLRVFLTLFCNSDGEHSPKVCPQGKYC